jgi:hypothetical protein
LARNRCSAPAINGATAGIGESEKPDQVIVDRRRGRLHDKDLLAAYGVEKLHGNLAVGISIHDTAADLSAQLARDRSAQRWVGRTGENREVIVHARLAPNRIRTRC